MNETEISQPRPGLGKSVTRGTDQQFPVGIVNQHQNSWPPVGKRVVRGRKWKEGGSEPVGCRSVGEPFLDPDFPPSGGYSLHSQKTRSVKVLRASSRKRARVSITHHPDSGKAFYFSEHQLSSCEHRASYKVRPTKIAEGYNKWLACHYVLVTSKRNLFSPVSNLTLLGSGKEGFGF